MPNLTAALSEMIDPAIEKHGAGERVLYEIALIPDKQGLPTPTIVCWLPSSIAGEIVIGSIQIADPHGATAEDLDDAMGSFLHQMREGRSQRLAQAHADAQAANPMQPGQRPSGLFVGGR